MGRPTERPPKEELAALYAKLKGKELAAHYGKSLDLIREWLSYYGIEKVPQRRAKRWGERQAKPTPEQQFVITERREPTPPRPIREPALPKVTKLCELPPSSQYVVRRAVSDFSTWLTFRREQ